MEVKAKNTSDLRFAASLYTPAGLKKTLSGNGQNYFFKTLNKFSADRKMTAKRKVSSVYRLLEKNYRNEIIYKNAIFDMVVSNYKMENTVVFDEFKIGSSIADVVMINGHCRVFEIKTELDKLDRLEEQISDYLKFADEVYIVCSHVHSDACKKIIDGSTVGLIVLDNHNKLKTIVKATRDTAKFNHAVLFKSLRVAEYSNITRSITGFVPDVPNTKIFSACYSAISSTDVSVFQRLVLKQLKQRKLKYPDALYSNDVPASLRYSCNSIDISKSQFDSLLTLLNKTI